MSPTILLVMKVIIAIVMILGLFGNCFTKKGEEEFAKWGFPPYFRFLIGGLEAVAAVMIFIPGLAFAGLALAGIIMAGAVATLVYYREYGHAVPAIITLVLIVVVLAFD